MTKYSKLMINMSKITPQKIKRMSYVELIAFLEQINRPPGGKDSIRLAVQNCFITKDSKVLDVGCNTGYCSFEIAHLTKCRVTGIDISTDMIRVAKKLQKADSLGSLIRFISTDAMRLPFKNETFDVVISGGSTAFINDKEKAVSEYKRVLKPWGFIADINFFYKTRPPREIINKLNKLMKTKIEPWNINYWLNLYNKRELEKYFIYTNDVKQVKKEKIKEYCIEMATQKSLSKEGQQVLIKRLIDIMTLFNKNYKYLAYGVFILRKRPVEDQISLFGS